MTSNFNLEKIFGKPLAEVDDIINHMDDHVKHIEIPKKDGSKRKILAPDDSLKWIQKRLNWLIFLRYKPSANAQGFVKSKSIVSNAKVHVKPKSLGHVDIKNFFDTINEKHISNCIFGNKNICRLCNHYTDMMAGKCSPSIYKNKTANYPHKCEEMKAVFIPDYCERKEYDSLFKRIIKLCTYKNSAAQGFPTSPYIANIVLRGFDLKMQKIAEENGCQYTRYADDLTFSSKTHTKEELQKLFKDPAYRTLWGFGFEANKAKTYWKDRGRFKVCGVVVNEKTNIMRRTIRTFRAKVHHAIVKHAERTTRGHIRKLKGWASYLMSVNLTQGQKYMKMLTDFEATKWRKAA
jgi:RNA-directed DNA polymerase